MKTKRSLAVQLVISFAAVAPAFRASVSAQVQQRLFALGYRWTGAPCPTDSAFTAADNLYINSGCWNPRDITWSSGAVYVTESDGRVAVFNGADANQLTEFLHKAEDAMTYRKVIQGVNVTITPFQVIVDPANLLANVSGVATALQKEFFG
jgi:hypothetical protein